MMQIVHPNSIMKQRVMSVTFSAVPCLILFRHYYVVKFQQYMYAALQIVFQYQSPSILFPASRCVFHIARCRKSLC